MRTKERGGGVYVPFKPGVAPDMTRAFDLVKAAGFKPRLSEVTFTVSGTVAAEEGKLILTADNMKAPAQFVLQEMTDSPKWIAVNKDTFARLKELATTNAMVEVEGVWQANADPKDSKPLPVLKVVTIAVKK